ncbi:inositol 1,4,5-trisphosphate receptor-like protein [Heterostelium album PN500]|uniref:Inositol 1,4,5-trisphosphate receptor-like protein n=1 Tax=Heterostelium pallidum (strain ATCC 26659 / Pp 5 / PN500) TaxID=670386 RepID=D3AX88_HETP5|nr:inositol 1,4,5-trisphosphate receptor-like protein [Heterostelium album PN500]EFA86157.1 inositol 1,4,5-trisphosphate receptor-like protein [Heterostelium album PN500]|eukprot:XP_020438262.1 inositol 1,4,5-trisphosphate receptor-like protein [Heterostelium album PN500]
MMMMDHHMGIGIDEDEVGKNLKTGDLVTFYSEQEEEEGFFSKAHDSAVLQPNKSKECVFKIHPMTQYTARKALKKKKRQGGGGTNSPIGTLGLGGMGGGDPADQDRDQELKQLEEYQDIEDTTNETALIQLEGRDLVYGQIIQLFHPKTNQFLFAKHYNAKHNRASAHTESPGRRQSPAVGLGAAASREDSVPSISINNTSINMSGGIPIGSSSNEISSSDSNNFKEDIPLILVPESEKYSPNSTFYFVPKEQNTIEHVTYGSFVRIQSLSKYWLHFINDETFFHNGDLVGTKKFFKYDDFQIKPIPKSQMEDYKFVSSRMTKIGHFVSPQELRKKISLQELRFILIELIKFCTQSDVEDPLEREGTPIKTHQSLLATSHNLKILLDLLNKFFNPLDPLTISYVYRIFKQISKSNVKIGITVNRHVKAISGPLELRERAVSFGLGAVLLDIYKNNHILLENLSEEKVIEFVDAIRQTRDPKYMELLSEICVCNNKPIVKNQQYLCDHLLEKNTDLLLKTRVTSQVEIEVKPGQWMSMADFMSKGDEKTQRYFEQSLSLYANVSRGRNYNGIRLVGQFASYKECFLCLKDENLPYTLRGSYTNVVIHKDMDCDPQKPYAKITYFWNPLDQTNAIEQQRQSTLGRNTKSSDTIRQHGSVNGTNNLTGNNSNSNNNNNNSNNSNNNSNFGSYNNNNNSLASMNGFGYYNNNINGSNMALASSGGGGEDDIFTMFPPMTEPLHVSDPSNISQFLMNYVLRPENFSWGLMYSSNISLQRPQWGFFHKILIAANYAFKFGFFKRKERILLNRLKDILEVQSSDASGGEVQSTDLGRTMGGSRLLEDDSSILVAIKIEILQILHQMLSLQKKAIFEQFLNEMSLNEQVQQTANNRSSSLDVTDSEEQIKRLLINKLDGTALNSQKPMPNHRNPFISTLFAQLKHENNILTSLVLSFLNRIYKYQNGYAQLYHPIRKLMILPAANVSNNIYSQSIKKMEEITKCCSNLLTNNETEEVLKILAYFIHMCEAGDAKAQKNQNMLKVIGIHKRIIGILKMGCTLENLVDERGEVCSLLSTTANNSGGIGSSGIQGGKLSMDSSFSSIHSSSSNTPTLETQRIQQSCFAAKIFRSCYEFFRAFCKNNPSIQQLLYGYIEFLIGHLIRYGNIFGTIETLMEIFKNNIKLCVSFGESPYMKLLIEFIIHQDVKDVDPVFLRFLNMIMKPSGYSAVTEIQISISNLLKEYRPVIAKWLLPFSTVKEVMKEPKGATISKFHKSNNSSTYKLHACLQEILLQSLQEHQQDGAGGNNNNNNNNSNNNNSSSISVSSVKTTNMSQSTQPKLMRSTAKHMLVTSMEEVLPREFVINLELVWLLSVCSYGRNTPTEIICRDFITMHDCFEVLVVRTDGTGREASSLMIHDTKEYLEQNLQFRFKSAYVSFLHEVYFNSDTLKGDLLALQLNENLWNLIDQFTNQLKFLYTCYSTDRLSSDYFLMMSRSIILPMISILERFYSQCFYFDKATQKHLLYSSVLMGNLLKFYSVDESIRVPMRASQQQAAANGNSINGSLSNNKKTLLQQTQSDEDLPSSGGIHPILMNLDLDEKINLLVSLVKCLKSMDRSAISPTSTPGISVSSVSEVIKGCEEIIARLDRQNSKWARQRSETTDDSVTLISKQSSTYLYDQKEHPMLKLFRERGYQQLALIVLEKDDKALNALLSGTDSAGGKVAVNTFLEILVFQLRNTLYENNSLKLHCIRILLSVLESHPQKKRIMQNQLTEMYCHSACIGLIGSKSHDVALEALNLLLALLEEQSDPTNPVPNEYVKESIQTYFSSSPDIQFFKHIYGMMERAKLSLRDTKRNLRMENIKHNISGGLVFERGNTILGLVHKHTDIDQVVDTNPYATEFLIMSNIFRVLQLLCQGSSSLFKSYIRCQPDNYKSYDLLRELCQFLKILETIVNIDLDSINLASRFFSCLKEIVKHTPENQIAVTNVQMCKAICNILRKSDIGGDPVKNEKYLDLKIEIMDFLLHVVDREDQRVVSRMIEELDYSVIEENTNMLGGSGGGSKTDNEKAIKLAAMSFRLIKILADNDTSQNRQLADCLQACGEHCRSRIGRVEMFHNSKLERIYFPIPSYSRRLILQAKEQSKIKNDENELQKDMEDYMINNEINWNKSAEKLDAFMVWSEIKLIELEHRHQLKQAPISYFISNHYNKWAYINFALAIVINILLIIYGTSGTTSFQDSSNFGATLFRATILPLSILQTIFSLLTSVSYFIGNAAVTVYKGWIKYLENQKSFMLRTNAERMHYVRSNFSFWRYLFINIRHIMTDAKSVYFIFSVIFSFLGLYNPLFYSFHIFQITLKTKALSIVIRAININKGTLILMGAFMIQATYVLSIFSYAFFAEFYVNGEGNFCSTLYQCFLGNIFYGVPTSGQLVQFVIFKFDQAYSNNGTAFVLAWTVFCVVFYVVTSIFLLNVILGIIVDTFGQLRDQRALTEDYKANICFICSIDRETFQKKGIDFNKHVEDDHNKWYYLYFFAYLKERVINKQQNQFSDSELHALRKIETNKSLSLFPVEASISLQGEHQKSDSMIQAIQDMEAKIATNVSSQVNTTIALLIDEIKLLRQQVNDLSNK